MGSLAAVIALTVLAGWLVTLGGADSIAPAVVSGRLAEEAEKVAADRPDLA
ncbi:MULTISPECIES: hypothetical protein [Frankia]|uniref:hypothetical protein n=1 Tax=Frankia TaxID=1854 RepID=UPI0012FECCE4|nr:MULTISPECIES: hypothetical protein [Frankia]